VIVLVVEFMFLALVALLVMGLVRRTQRRRAAKIRSGEQVGVPCMLKWPSQGPRWRAGRLVIGSEPLIWKPVLGKQTITLPADLHRTGTRSPSLREAMSVNPLSRIVECGSSGGEVWIAVMPGDLPHVTDSVRAG
jgi:hypothetical protein